MNGPARILVVDEDADHLEIVATLLDHHGYRVACETSPGTGLTTAQVRRPDIIVTALHFGGLPAGLSFIDLLRERPATASIPIVVVSSFTDMHEQELRARNVRCVQKGGHLGRIIEEIESLLDPG
ncbi:MAG TPA: response regulator [Longimicrobiales bacterium]|nr:response regulator [Longimicrobiales bacterium]